LARRLVNTKGCARIMKTPVIVYNWGDLFVYSTIEEAEQALEAIDVQNGEYFACLVTDEILEGNVLASLEREVGIALLPEEVAARATTTITAAESRKILSSMGIDLPRAIPSKSALTEVLHETPRLNIEQINRFVDLAQGTEW